MENKSFEPREYQQEILESTCYSVLNNQNTIIELDCGLGKRYLQYSLIFEKFKDKKIILILQASSSLYETFNYLKAHSDPTILDIVDSRTSSKLRKWKLENKRVILCLPQTLSNTLKKFPESIDDVDIIIINEVDLLIRRTSEGEYLKQPYTKLLPKFRNKLIIGMSGTLRDEHFVLDNEQLKMRNELKSLSNMIGNVSFLSMDSIMGTDVGNYIEYSEIIPTAILDDKLSFISMEVDLQIESTRNEILSEIRKVDRELYRQMKRDPGMMFNPLPVSEKLQQKLFVGYLTRKYLWAMTGKKSQFHLMRYGIDPKFVKQNLPIIPAKFHAIKYLIDRSEKAVILCSYLETVDVLNRILHNLGLKTVIVTGRVNNLKRTDQLEEFRACNGKIVAIISNVGERDLDLPDADTLIIFDLVRTTKTVYQKLKRSRGGKCHILFYSDTSEEKKVKAVIQKIHDKYSWSTKIEPQQVINTLNKKNKLLKAKIVAE
ncbi:MAG: helicase-related protein [Candidatus Kariarchaeaceae archaeon]